MFMLLLFFFSSRRRHTRLRRDWSSDVCSSDLWEQITGSDNDGCTLEEIESGSCVPVGDGICDTDLNGELIDCVSDGSAHLMYYEDGSIAESPVIGGFDRCRVCNGDGFMNENGVGCGFEAVGDLGKIDLNWNKPFTSDESGETSARSSGRSGNGRSSSSETATYTNSSQVELEIDSDSVVIVDSTNGAGTLDIIMQNYPGCKDFCVDPKEEEHPNCFINGEYVCFGELGEGNCIVAEGEWYDFVREDEIELNISKCSELSGTWFDGYVGGFQIELTGVSITGATGGSAEGNGFTVSTSQTTVLGFSLTGSTIPAGSEILTQVSFEGYSPDGEGICITSIQTGNSGDRKSVV